MRNWIKKTAIFLALCFLLRNFTVALAADAQEQPSNMTEAVPERFKMGN